MNHFEREKTMKLFASLLALNSAVNIDTRYKTSFADKLDEYFDEATQMQINMMREGILRNQIGGDYMKKLDELCDPCRPQATLQEVMTLLPLPALNANNEDAKKKVEVFVGITCEAVSCRDRVIDCATRASEGVCETNFNWAQQYCAQTCGCVRKTCQKDQMIPGARQEQVVAYLENEEDAEHSSAMDLPMHVAVGYLDPSKIFAKFDKKVQDTLQAQMCHVPDANARIIAANEMLKVLAENEDARILNALSPKLPMYLEALPENQKKILANQTICGGYKRTATANSCLGPRITPQTRYCRANLPRFTYNVETGLCEKVNYDGCFNTENRFMTQTACDETCADYKSALLQVQKQKLQKFIDSLTANNLRERVLLMFGKATSEETTEDLIDITCDAEQGNVRVEFRDILCERLYSVLAEISLPKAKQIAQNPVVIEHETCEAELADRESCVAKPRRGFKAACEAAGCCWDSAPQTKFAKWRHYCFKTKKIQSKPTMPIVQEEPDSEHSSCAVEPSNRSFCAERNRAATTMAEVRAACESQGCCFEEKPGGGVYYKWRLSCFNPN